MKIYNSHTGRILEDTGDVGISTVDDLPRTPDHNTAFDIRLASGDTFRLYDYELLALKYLLPRLVDMDLFRTLVEATGINGEAALASSIRSQYDT